MILSLSSIVDTVTLVFVVGKGPAPVVGAGVGGVGAGVGGLNSGVGELTDTTCGNASITNHIMLVQPCSSSCARIWWLNGSRRYPSQI